MDKTIRTHCASLMSYHELCADPEQAQFTFSYLITDGMKSIDSSLSNKRHQHHYLERCKDRVNYILNQIESLEHYLPETYQMLMDELDQQQKALKQLEIQDFYQRQENAEQDQAVNSTNQNQSQK